MSGGWPQRDVLEASITGNYISQLRAQCWIEVRLSAHQGALHRTLAHIIG
jgi:hypothetical protein